MTPKNVSTLQGDKMVTNKNSRIVTTLTPNGKVRTSTRYRDGGSDRVAISTDSNNKTTLFVDLDGGEIRGGETIKFDGHQARTLFRVLSKHYN